MTNKNVYDYEKDWNKETWLIRKLYHKTITNSTNSLWVLIQMRSLYGKPSIGEHTLRCSHEQPLITTGSPAHQQSGTVQGLALPVDHFRLQQWTALLGMGMNWCRNSCWTLVGSGSGKRYSCSLDIPFWGWFGAVRGGPRNRNIFQKTQHRKSKLQGKGEGRILTSVGNTNSDPPKLRSTAGCQLQSSH